MIVYYGCYNCKTFVRVDGHPHEIARLLETHIKWVQGRPCFRCRGEMVAIPFELLPSTKDALFLSPQQLFLAWCGGGLPEDIESARDVVRSCLLGAKIIRVDTSEISDDVRPVIQRLYLEDGRVVHLAGTSLGAMVYKVTKHGQDTCDQVGVQSKTENDTVRRPPDDLPDEREGARPEGDA